MDGAQISVFKQADKVRFGCLLKGTDGGRLETEVSAKVLRNFPDKPLEGQLSDEKFGAFLVRPDFAKGDSAGSVPVLFFLATTSRGRFAGGFCGKLLARCLAAGVLACCLFGSGHVDVWCLGFGGFEFLKFVRGFEL